MSNCMVFCPMSLEGVPGALADAVGDSYIIAVDGGIQHIEKVGILPQLWVGDGDSTPKGVQKLKKLKKLGVQFLKLKKAKDYSDLEFALQMAGMAFLEGDWDGSLILLGAQGGRFDCELANMMSVQRWLQDMAEACGANQCPDVVSYGPNGAWVASINRVEFKARKRELFSVVTLNRETKITVRGAKYNAKAQAFEHGSRGLSNEGVGKKVTIELAATKKKGVDPDPFFVVFPR